VVNGCREPHQGDDEETRVLLAVPLSEVFGERTVLMEVAMGFVPFTCPGCGAAIPVPDDRPMAYCSCCGRQLQIGRDETSVRTHDDGVGAWVPVIVSGAGFLILPTLEELSFYLPLFRLDSNIQFGQFSLLGFVAVLLAVPAPVVAGVFYARCRRLGRPVLPSLIGLGIGVLLMLVMVVLYLFLHSNVLTGR
jgi:hypothetical protein